MPEACAVFLDRDGTIMADVGYPKDPDQVRLLPGVGEALAKLKELGFRLILVSNQSGIGRGVVAPEEAEQVHQRVVTCLEACGVSLDAAYYCPHAPEAGCRCRKPSPEFLFQAAKEFDLDLAKSFMIGDKATDMEAGRQAGCRTILLRTPGQPYPVGAEAHAVAYDWQEITSRLLGFIGKQA